MIVAISDFLLKISKYEIIFFFVVLFLCFHVLVFPHFLEKIGSGPDSVIPDLMFGFSKYQVNSFLSHAGYEGRQAYFAVLLVDSIYPLIYSLLLAMVMGKTMKLMPISTKIFKRTNLIPLGAALADYLENAGILYLLSAYPAQIGIIAQLASIFNMAKWALVAVSIGLISFMFASFVSYSLLTRAKGT